MLQHVTHIWLPNRMRFLQLKLQPRALSPPPLSLSLFQCNAPSIFIFTISRGRRCFFSESFACISISIGIHIMYVHMMVHSLVLHRHILFLFFLFCFSLLFTILSRSILRLLLHAKCIWKKEHFVVKILPYESVDTWNGIPYLLQFRCTCECNVRAR